MTELFAIKRSDAWLWTGRLTRAEIIAKVDDKLLAIDWLVCPLGCAQHAVTVEQFVKDEEVFARLRSRDQETENERQRIIKSVHKPSMFRAGMKLLTMCILSLIVGRATFSLVPQFRRLGWDVVLWFVLVPIWTIGIVGLLLLLSGWIVWRLRVLRALDEAGR